MAEVVPVADGLNVGSEGDGGPPRRMDEDRQADVLLGSKGRCRG